MSLDDCISVYMFTFSVVLGIEGGLFPAPLPGCSCLAEELCFRSPSQE
jgi:hypothetical protein